MTEYALKGKRVLVVGLGKSGLAAAKLLLKKGARVTLTKRKNERKWLVF